MHTNKAIRIHDASINKYGVSACGMAASRKIFLAVEQSKRKQKTFTVALHTTDVRIMRAYDTDTHTHVHVDVKLKRKVIINNKNQYYVFSNREISNGANL